jgi:hypothetical protein
MLGMSCPGKGMNAAATVAKIEGYQLWKHVGIQPMGSGKTE